MFSILRRLFSSKKPDLEALFVEGAIVIDVRTVTEYNRGHGKGSRHIPLQSLPSKITALNKQQKTLITCCASGIRSGKAAIILNQAGLTAFNGGSWQQVEQARQRSQTVE